MWREVVVSATLFATSKAIWPLPVSQSTGSDVVWIDNSAQVHYSAPGMNQSLVLRDVTNNTSVDWSKRIINNAISRTHDTLFHQNFVPWMFHPRNSNFEPSQSSSSVKVTTINLVQHKADPATIMKPAIGDVDESYELTMTSAGEVTISGNSSIGIAHGMTTFTQLFYEHSHNGGVYSPLAPVEISDAPKFPWRGLNIDTSRTFKPVRDILSQIDGLAYNKFNRLHWHITDAQSWPLVIPSMPELANKGAYHQSQIYTPQDVQTIYEYGAENGVQVVMEIDQPGHTTSVGLAYPDLIAAFNIQPDWTTYANEPPSGQFKLNDTAVESFLEKLFDDLLPRLTPLSAYFHLGGDELNANVYLLDEGVKSNDSSKIKPFLQQFQNQNMKRMQKAGLVPLVWEEQLLQWNLSLPKNTIIQVWEESSSVLQVVQQGYQVLTGDYNFFYLDCGFGQWLTFEPGKDSSDFWPYQDYCAPMHNWKLAYSYNPVQGIPEHLQKLVLGGECHIWSEQTDTHSLDFMVWPRASAVGEVLWSGSVDAQGHNRSQITAAPRLADMRERLVARGLKGAPIQMPFCTQNGTMQCVYPPSA